MSRIEIEAEYYIEWEDILDFFTKRGRPEQIEKRILQQEENKKKEQENQRKFKIEFEKNKQFISKEGNRQLNEYDLEIEDPQDYKEIYEDEEIDNFQRLSKQYDVPKSMKFDDEEEMDFAKMSRDTLKKE